MLLLLCYSSLTGGSREDKVSVVVVVVVVVIVVIVIIVVVVVVIGRANFFYRSLASKEVSESMEELADARLVPLSEPDIPDDEPIIPIN